MDRLLNEREIRNLLLEQNEYETLSVIAKAQLVKADKWWVKMMEKYKSYTDDGKLDCYCLLPNEWERIKKEIGL
jgi:hypothetical protein